MTATVTEQPAAEQAPDKAAPKPAAKPAANKPAAKAAPAKPAPKPEPQTPDSPLTPEQKRQVGSAVIAAAAKFIASNPAAIKGLPANTVKAQVAAWMAYLPHDQWPAALPKPTRR